MNAFTQYHYIQALSDILCKADSINHTEIAGLALNELIEQGLQYTVADGRILTEVNGEEKQFSSSLLNYRKNSFSQIPSGNSPFGTPYTQQDAVKSEFPGFNPTSPRPGSPMTSSAPKEEPDFFANFFNHLPSEEQNRTPSAPTVFGDGFLTNPVLDFENFQSEPTESYSAPEPLKEQEPAVSQDFSADVVQVGFGRMDADTEPIARPTSMLLQEETQEEGQEVAFLPPLNDEFTPNYEIPLSDCVYSMFVGSVFEDTSLVKNPIYFMVAPFRIQKNEPTTNILFYAFYNHQSYAVTSLSNQNKNSLTCQIGQFQFLVRGKFTDGKWKAEVKLTGDSLRRNDKLEIAKEYHSNPDTIGHTNGHIRFTYNGYVNRKDLLSKGCVNIFPVDAEGKDFIVIRCIEDFIDPIFTDEVSDIILHTQDGDKKLNISTVQGVMRATLSDYHAEEEALFHE